MPRAEARGYLLLIMFRKSTINPYYFKLLIYIYQLKRFLRNPIQNILLNLKNQKELTNYFKFSQSLFSMIGPSIFFNEEHAF